MVTAYTKNLYTSEVYRELERQAVRKGHFEPTPEDLVKSAANQVTQHRDINKPVPTTPTDDLIQDVARLAFAMRRKGFITQAEDLEQKLVIYKQAESSLYDVTPEKNSDFVQFSHRDGDVEIIEGAGELGKVETIESAAEKIRAVTRKEPTGKLAALAELAGLVKSADLGDSGEGGGDYANDIRAELTGEYKKVNDHFAAYPPVGRLAKTAQLSADDVLGGGVPAQLYLDAVKQAGVKGAENLTAERISSVADLKKKLADLGIKGHEQSHAPFAQYLERNRTNLQKLRELTSLLGTGASWIHGFKLNLNGQDATGIDPSKYNWTGIQQGTPILNRGSGLILIGTGGRGGNPYIKTTDIRWDPGIKDQMARTLRQAYYNKSDAVFGRNFSALSQANAKIAESIQALDSIRKIRVKTPDGAVDENGAVNASVAMTPLRDARTQYDQTTKKNNLGYEAIRRTDVDTASAMRDWQTKLYEILGTVQNSIANLSGQEMIDVSGAMRKLQAARRAWESVREVLRPLRGPDVPKKIRDVATNVTIINRLIASLNSLGTPKIMTKPKKLVSAWLQSNDFTKMSEVGEWADGAISMAEAEKAKAQAMTGGERV